MAQDAAGGHLVAAVYCANMPADQGATPYVIGAYREGRGSEMAPLLGYAVDADLASLPPEEAAALERERRGSLKFIPIAIEFAGPRTIVDSIRRDLARGDRVHLDHGAGSVNARLLRASLYRFFTGALPNGYAHLLCLHVRATLSGMQPGQPAYLVDPAKHAASIPHGGPCERPLLHFANILSVLLPLPVFPEWTQGLWAEGLRTGLVNALDERDGPFGWTYGLSAWQVLPDIPRWHALVRAGLTSGTLSTPRAP